MTINAIKTLGVELERAILKHIPAADERDDLVRHSVRIELRHESPPPLDLWWVYLSIFLPK